MKTSLYNQDGSLHPEAQFLLSFKSSNMSIGDWKKRMKAFKSQLSAEDLKKFERLKAKEHDANWYAKNPESSKEKSARRRAKDPEKVRAENAKWRAENPEKAKKDNAKWRTENPEKVRRDRAKWYAENTEKAKKDNAKWRTENPEKVKENRAKWRVKKIAEDPLFRLQDSMRSGCRRVVKQLSLGKKPVSTFKWIGCSPEELKAHLESLFTEGMTWENYGEWHVDHIRPVCSFTAEEWEQVNHYTNLRPLWAEDNFAKSGFDKQQSVRSKNKMETVEVSEPKKSQTSVANKD